MECQLHTKPNSNIVRQGTLQLQSRNTEREEHMEEQSVEHQLEGPICDCQVKKRYTCIVYYTNLSFCNIKGKIPTDIFYLTSAVMKNRLTQTKGDNPPTHDEGL